MDKSFQQYKTGELKTERDAIASTRKKDHIEMAFNSQVDQQELDSRFYYEPLLAAHPKIGEHSDISFLGKKLRAPLWISSMTGGTREALTINHNLARACREFGLGMGLGSCRALLYSDERLPDFDLRSIIGPDQPFFANLGIAQLEELLENKSLHLAIELVEKLQADGLIIHVNPFQEWLQPEGDHFNLPPLDTIQQCLEAFPFPIIVKEVGQGMGPESLEALMKLPLAAIDFAASGGTNFALMELMRSNEQARIHFQSLAYQGHSAQQMIQFVNDAQERLGDEIKCREFIISGGVKGFLDGYYYTSKLNANCVYGQASSFLKHARNNYSDLHQYVDSELKGLALAQSFLRVK